ncbi:hypothetical protein B9G55_01305 [Saccharibacillus sp. O16]|nr:hypothetical protein B9G55_01305 [Saccharibacillus sp. O16]
MTKIVLESLRLTNFKGFEQFLFETGGGNVSGFGTNATGKTTIVDAFTWLLFGKDSAGRSDFEIKPLNSRGQVAQHGLDHEVEGVLLVDGQRRTFRKVFAEKWTKQRGSATAEFTGHKTDHFLDGVPVTAGEYKASVAALIPEELFRLLTLPDYFNGLKMEARRKILLDVCGDMADEDVVSSNEEIAKLIIGLNGRSIDDQKKVIASERQRVNKELEKIPIRIDEARRSIPDVSELDETLLDDDLYTLRGRIEAREAEASRIRGGGEVATKRKQIAELEAGMLDIKSRLQSVGMDAAAKQREVVNRLHAECDQIRRTIDDKQQRRRNNERTIDARRQEANRLRAEWTQVDAEQMVEHHADNCPTCGQMLPEEQIQAAHEKAEAEYRRQKSERLQRINDAGRAAVAEIQQLASDNAKLTTEIESAGEQLANLQVQVSDAETTLNELRAGITDPLGNPEYVEKSSEVDMLRTEIYQLEQSTDTALAKIREDVCKLREEIATIEQDKARIAQARTVQQRIIELEAQERHLADEYERLEEQLFLIEEFIRTKVAMLEQRINGKFQLARFRLFETQINGGLKEVCDTMYGGVPYDGGLNNAARINVGLDIINTLSAHYGVEAPIWIDNAESVVQLVDTRAQVIRLVVSEADRKLRIETTMQEAI